MPPASLSLQLHLHTLMALVA